MFVFRPPHLRAKRSEAERARKGVSPPFERSEASEKLFYRLVRKSRFFTSPPLSLPLSIST